MAPDDAPTHSRDWSDRALGTDAFTIDARVARAPRSARWGTTLFGAAAGLVLGLLAWWEYGHWLGVVTLPLLVPQLFDPTVARARATLAASVSDTLPGSFGRAGEWVAIRASGKVVRARIDELRNVFVEPTGERSAALVLQPSDGSTWTVAGLSIGQAEAIAAALGAKVADAPIRFPLAAPTSRSFVAEIAGFFGVLVAPLLVLVALALGGLAVTDHSPGGLIPAGICVVLALLAQLAHRWLRRPKTLLIGRDGLRIEGMFRTRVVPIAEIAAVSDTTLGAALRLRDGRDLSLVMLPRTAPATMDAELGAARAGLAYQLRRVLTQAAARSDATSEGLERGAQSIEDWLASLRRLGGAAGYRDGADDERIAAVLDDVHAKPAIRVAAAVALASQARPEHRARIAEAAQATVDPALAEALTAAERGELTESLERASAAGR